jgi:glutamine amidotransferase
VSDDAPGAPGRAAEEAPLISVLDYGMGNLRSVEKALEHVGARAVVSADPEAIGAADGLILPGVGAFPRAMERIRATGLDELIAARAAAGTPILGICLGLQLLFERSEELGGATGLGLLRGPVKKLHARGEKLPHIGWSAVRWERPPAESRLATGIESGTPFYFVHSYAVEPREDVDALGATEYGAPFVCAIEHRNVFGVQFHPEKSSTAGLRLLANFAGVCAKAPAAA